MFEKKHARNMARNHTQVKKNAGTLTKPQTPSEHEHDMHEHEAENSHEA